MLFNSILHAHIPKNYIFRILGILGHYALGGNFGPKTGQKSIWGQTKKYTSRNSPKDTKKPKKLEWSKTGDPGAWNDCGTPTTPTTATTPPWWQYPSPRGKNEMCPTLPFYTGWSSISNSRVINQGIFKKLIFSTCSSNILTRITQIWRHLTSSLWVIDFRARCRISSRSNY